MSYLSHSNMNDFVEKIISWKLNRHMLYPEDVLNMLIDSDLCSISEIQEKIEEASKNKLDPSLPNTYIINTK